ncbi:MAG: translation initiation factor IF-2 [Mycoplasma sp.]
MKAKRPIKKSNQKNIRRVDNRTQVNIKEQLKTVNTGVKDGVFVFTSPLTLGELAPKINKSTAELIKYFFLKGKMVTINDLLTIEQIGEICLENNLDFKIEKEISAENVLDNIDFKDSDENLQKKPPIVTIMGHVDHGKTSLLDKIRLSSVASGEAGAITQHIGAYQIIHNTNPITFIDTPGHEAFSEMRARGANVTDIVVLVVAADDGVKPQTEEAIDHAKLANVPIIVFVNKMDKPEANPEKVISQLSEHNLVTEEWGGDTIFIQGSAHTGAGLDKLLDAITTMAEMQDLKANPNRLAYGTVIETKLDKGFGPVATVIVQNGTLRKSDYAVVGSTYGRIRLMQDENGNELLSAGPAKPAIIIGIEHIATPGEKFLCITDEKEAKAIANKIYQKKQREEQFKNLNTQSVRSKIANGELKNLNVIIRADVAGSLEAIKGMVAKLNIDGATVITVKASTGGITESDIRLAQTSSALIVGFNIRPLRTIAEFANNSNVSIMCFDIIYKLKEELEAMLKGVLDPIYEEQILGELEVLKIWKHSDVGTILGVKVTHGKVTRKSKCRIIRDGVIIYNSEISTLKHQKDDIKEALAGRECGCTIKNFNDFKEGDLIETFIDVQKSYDEVKKNG